MDLLPTLAKIYSHSVIATGDYRRAFGIISGNINTNIKNDWIRAIHILEHARSFTYSPYRKMKCTRLIKLCNEKLAGVSNYSSLGIGYYAGGREIKRDEYVSKMNKATKARRKGQ